MADAPPAFLLYVSDFLSSDTVSLMTNEQIGAYVLLLCHQWQRAEGLPDSLEKLARLARCSTRRFERVIWPALAEKFPLNEAGLRANPKLEKVRAQRVAFTAERRDAGRRGAAKRWGKERQGDSSANSSANGSANSSANGSANGKPVAEGMANGCLSFSSTRTPPNPPQGGRSPERTSPPSPAPVDDVAVFLEGYRERYGRIVGGRLPLVWPHKDVAIARELLQTWPVDRLLAMAEIFLRRDDKEVAGKPKSLAWFRHYAPWCESQCVTARPTACRRGHQPPCRDEAECSQRYRDALKAEAAAAGVQR